MNYQHTSTQQHVLGNDTTHESVIHGMGNQNNRTFSSTAKKSFSKASWDASSRPLLLKCATASNRGSMRWEQAGPQDRTVTSVHDDWTADRDAAQIPSRVLLSPPVQSESDGHVSAATSHAAPPLYSAPTTSRLLAPHPISPIRRAHLGPPDPPVILSPPARAPTVSAARSASYGAPHKLPQPDTAGRQGSSQKGSHHSG